MLLRSDKLLKWHLIGLSMVVMVKGCWHLVWVLCQLILIQYVYMQAFAGTDLEPHSALSSIWTGFVRRHKNEYSHEHRYTRLSRKTNDINRWENLIASPQKPIVNNIDIYIPLLYGHTLWEVERTGLRRDGPYTAARNIHISVHTSSWVRTSTHGTGIRHYA